MRNPKLRQILCVAVACSVALQQGAAQLPLAIVEYKQPALARFKQQSPDTYLDEAVYPYKYLRSLQVDDGRAAIAPAVQLVEARYDLVSQLAAVSKQVSERVSD